MNKKIGLDFHGVISAEPILFAEFCKEIRQYGILVYIISGGPRNDIIKYLDAYHIEYDYIWAILDVCEQKGTVAFYEDGSFQVPTDIWDKAKAEYCVAEGIDFHIDDSNIYGKYFVTPYCKYDICKGHCKINGGLDVDFSRPKLAAKVIAEFLLTSSNKE